MASRGGPMITGTDGADFEHRQRVAAHYQIRWPYPINISRTFMQIPWISFTAELGWPPPDATIVCKSYTTTKVRKILRMKIVEIYLGQFHAFAFTLHLSRVAAVRRSAVLVILKALRSLRKINVSCLVRTQIIQRK